MFKLESCAHSRQRFDNTKNIASMETVTEHVAHSTVALYRRHKFFHKRAASLLGHCKDLASLNVMSVHNALLVVVPSNL